MPPKFMSTYIEELRSVTATFSLLTLIGLKLGAIL